MSPLTFGPTAKCVYLSDLRCTLLNFDLKSRLLCCEHFSERHTAVNIANRYEDVVMRYQIDGKVRRIISENASSLKKAFELSLIDMKALEQEAAEM